ncbi:hypothetical protein [Bradyrhizobium sp. RDM4]|uniref:hypothetical protein n=1 Tax=Bradyrhizobium sp. RDM4 TaxID=3378765 RepID=UPI0038FBE6A1
MIRGQALEFFHARAIFREMRQLEHGIGGAIQRFRPIQQSLARLLQFTLIIGEPDVSYGELHASSSKLGFDRIPRQLLLRECGLVGIMHIAVANQLAHDHGDDKNNAERRSDREFGADLRIFGPGSTWGFGKTRPNHCRPPSASAGHSDLVNNRSRRNN